MTDQHSVHDKVVAALRVAPSSAAWGWLALVAAFTAFLDQPAKAANAITDLPAAFDQARVIHVKGRQCFPGQRQENGQPVPPVDLDTWIDLQNGRTRQTQTGMSQRSQMSSGSGASTTTTVTVTETICDGKYIMTVNHTAKTPPVIRLRKISQLGWVKTHRNSDSNAVNDGVHAMFGLLALGISGISNTPPLSPFPARRPTSLFTQSAPQKGRNLN